MIAGSEGFASAAAHITARRGIIYLTPTLSTLVEV
jgi:hypothetical protein